MEQTDLKKTECPHCHLPECCTESQTILDPGKSEVRVDSFLCLACGFTTTSLNQDGSDLVKQYEELTAELIKSLRWVDQKTNLVWYPIVLNFPTFGIIFPDGSSSQSWQWNASPSVDIPLQDQHKYPIPGQPNKFYTKRVDQAAGRKFEPKDFLQACKFIGFIK